jgi:hypothetical protein
MAAQRLVAWVTSRLADVRCEVHNISPTVVLLEQSSTNAPFALCDLCCNNLKSKAEEAVKPSRDLPPTRAACKRPVQPRALLRADGRLRSQTPPFLETAEPSAWERPRMLLAKPHKRRRGLTREAYQIRCMRQEQRAKAHKVNHSTGINLKVRRV